MELEQAELQRNVNNLKKDFVDLVEKHSEFLAVESLFFVIFSTATDGVLYCAPNYNEAVKLMDEGMRQGILHFHEKKGLKC